MALWLITSSRMTAIKELHTLPLQVTSIQWQKKWFLLRSIEYRVRKLSKTGIKVVKIGFPMITTLLYLINLQLWSLESYFQMMLLSIILFNFKYSKLKNAPMKISNMITMSEKTKKQDLSKMSKEEYLSLMIKKLNEFDDFMKVENHKRWFRNGNPELTSSLIRSQINMIRSTFGLNTQK